MKRRDARALDHKTLEEIRFRAVERVQAGESPEVVIQALGFTRSCIYTWLARYRAGGWGALKARALKGRPLKVQPTQMRWLYQTVTGKSPLQFRFEFALWTREMIRVLLRERFQLQLSLASVGRLLKQLGLTCQRPLFRAMEQDPERVRRWREQEYPAIREQARKAGAEIYFGDEAGVRSDCHAGTTWGIKGQTPVVYRTGQRSSVNMISAVSARGRLRFMATKGRVNGIVFMEFLKRLMHKAPRPIFLILDGGSYHRSRPVKDYVATVYGGVQVSMPRSFLNGEHASTASKWKRSLLRLVTLTKDDAQTALLNLPDLFAETEQNSVDAVNVEIRLFEFRQAGQRRCYPALLIRD